MRNAARFSRRSTFTCQVCHHVTREAGENDGLELCPICAELAGLQNTLSDSGEVSFREWKLVPVVAGLRREATEKRDAAKLARILEDYSDLFALTEEQPSSPAPAEVAPQPRIVSVTREGHHTVEQLVDLVLENARKRYDRGGDLLIECHTRAEIAEAIGQSTTAKGAIFWTWRRLGIHERHSHRRDIQGA